MDWTKVSAELAKPLDDRHVKPPPAGKYGDYLEAVHIIYEANRIFGFDGWSYTVHGVSLTNAAMSGDKHRVGYMAMCTVTVDGVSKTDIGHGQGFGKSEGDAHDSAAKEAATDALKRALRTFGNPFGLALYDKSKSNVCDGAAMERREREKAEAAKAEASRQAEAIRAAPDELEAGGHIARNAALLARMFVYPEAWKVIEAAVAERGMTIMVRDGKTEAVSLTSADDLPGVAHAAQNLMAG